MVSVDNVIFIVLATLWVALLFKLAGAKWDGLRVSYKYDVFNENAFARLPRTVPDALTQGFVKISDCDVYGKWRGNRYVKDDDFSTILLYDVNGYIAGIQTAVPKGLKSGYPILGLTPPFVEDTADRFVMSVYFVDPALICTTGRNASQFADQGTGTAVYVQNGSVAERQSLEVPRLEKDVAMSTWVLGRCLPAMGIHYWYATSYEMNCHAFFPVVALYNNGELTAFAFVLTTRVAGSHRYEYFPKFTYKYLFHQVPKCVYFVDRLTTLHVYLTERVMTNTCNPASQGSRHKYAVLEDGKRSRRVLKDGRE